MTDKKRECAYCKQDWKTKTDTPYFTTGMMFCNKNCAIDYLFKEISRIKNKICK